MHFSLGWCRDVALYALGVGACNADAADEKELQLVYHRDGQSSIKVLKMSWWGCVRLIFFPFNHCIAFIGVLRRVFKS